MLHNPVVWFEIYVQDMPRAKAFYETVLGIELHALEAPMPDLEMFAFPHQQNLGGATGELVKMEGVLPGMGGTLIYFSCEDCGVEAQLAASNGGSIFRDKFSIGPYGHIALVIDTEGNMIGLYTAPEGGC